MEQLYLTGRTAPIMAIRLFHALNMEPSGFRLLPFEVGGEMRGEALHLLHTAERTFNDVPVRIRVGDGDFVCVPEVLEEIAAPALRRCAMMNRIVLVDGVSEDVLAVSAFRAALHDLLLGDTPVVVVTLDDASAVLHDLTPGNTQLWMNVPDDADGQVRLLEELVMEATLRIL